MTPLELAGLIIGHLDHAQNLLSLSGRPTAQQVREAKVAIELAKQGVEKLYAITEPRERTTD